MKILNFTILAVLFITAVLCQDSDPNTEPTEATTPTTTTESTISTESTTTSSTTTPTTTSSTTTQTTTSSTTPATTTTTSTTSSSTSTTTTTTTTTKAPQPTPPTPEDCSWNVTQNNVTCIRAEMKAIFTIPIGDRIEYIALSPNASDDQSNCNLTNDTQSLVLSETDHYTLTMIFAKEGNKVFVNETIFRYKLPAITDVVSSDAKLFSVKAGNSYMCRSPVDVKLGNITMQVHDLHIQAFGEQGNANFGSAEECEADDKVSDAVPIAVGCALAALIIIVLIAYLVGRRRSRQRGYQSV